MYEGKLNPVRPLAQIRSFQQRTSAEQRKSERGKNLISKQTVGDGPALTAGMFSLCDHSRMSTKIRNFVGLRLSSSPLFSSCYLSVAFCTNRLRWQKGKQPTQWRFRVVRSLLSRYRFNFVSHHDERPHLLLRTR